MVSSLICSLPSCKDCIYSAMNLKLFFVMVRYMNLFMIVNLSLYFIYGFIYSDSYPLIHCRAVLIRLWNLIWWSLIFIWLLPVHSLPVHIAFKTSVKKKSFMSKIEGLVNIALKLESSINCYKAVSVFVQYRGLNVNSLFLHGMTSSHIFFFRHWITFLQ